MPVEVRCEVPGGVRYARALRADASALLELTSLYAHELSLLIVDDRAIRRLNRAWRGRDRATDVLSFSQLEEASGPRGQRSRPRGRLPRGGKCEAVSGVSRALGDVVISIDTARRQAGALKRAGRRDASLASRLRTLLIHGFLHVLGYDHERSSEEAELMFARERELARALHPLARPRGLRLRKRS